MISSARCAAIVDPAGDCLGGFQIDDPSAGVTVQDREVAALFAVEEAAGVDADFPLAYGVIRRAVASPAPQDR
jgi:hypothetical protein